MRYSFTFILLLFFSCVSAQDLQKGRVAYYPFTGNAMDQVGSNHGLVRGASLEADRFGNNGSAYQFDGIDDFIELPNSSIINFGAEEDFTISLWVYIEEDQRDLNGHNNEILGKWNAYTSTGYPYAIRYWNRNAAPSNQFKIFNMRYDSESCRNNPTITGYCEISSNEWHHIVMRKQGRQISYFQDGKLFGTVEDNTKYSCDTKNSNPVFIGKRDLDTRFFTGKIDDISFYNRAITDAEVEALLGENNWSPPPSPFHANFESFSFKEETAPANIDPVNHKIEIEVQCSAQLSNLVATFSLAGEVYASVNGQRQISGQSINNFTLPVEYVLKENRGCKEQVWTVYVKKEKAALEAGFLQYSIAEQVRPAEIKNTTKTIEVEVACSTDLTNLFAEFNLPEGSVAFVNGVRQESGISSNDFRGPVQYLIKNEKECIEEEWTVLVRQENMADLTGAPIKSFNLPNQKDPTVIDFDKRTIEVPLQCGTNVSDLESFFTLEPGFKAEVGGEQQESGLTKNNFSKPVIFHFSNEENCSQEDWTVYVVFRQWDLDTDDFVSKKLFIPNVFTPNEDGFNDSFEIGDLLQGCELIVYNRFGKEVYRSFDYRNDFYGNQLTPGVYYYIIRSLCLAEPFKGWVIILKD